MDRERFSTFSVFMGPGGMGSSPGVRAFQAVASQPSWVIRAAVIAAGVALGAIMLMVMVPVVLVAAAVFFAAAGVAMVRRWLGGLRRPNGALDGRKNVRVIVRQGE